MSVRPDTASQKGGSVTRMLRYFQSEGLVRLTRGSIEIVSEEKLEKLR